MRETVFRPEAEADIEELTDYTIAHWGHQQALDYVRNLRAAADSLATVALHYPPLDPIHPGLRRKRSAMHHIYYLTFAESIEIVRIIHVQRDPGMHLNFET